MEKEIINRVKELINPILEEDKVELVDVTYNKQYARMVLRILVDKEGGIRLNQCSTLNRNITESIDLSGMINQPYILEVSSPGLDRPLKEYSDFRRAIGEDVSITISSGKTFKGKLSGLNDKNIVVINKKQAEEIPIQTIIRAKRNIRI